MHRFIKFKQEAWLKPYSYINKELRKNAKKQISQIFFQADESLSF